MGSHKRKKKNLGSFSFFGVMFSMTLALFILSLLSMMLLLANNLTKYIQSNIEMQVFLKRDITENETIRLQGILADMDFILKKENVPQVSYTSKEDAAQDFSEEIGEDFLRYTEENPLSDILTSLSPMTIKHPHILPTSRKK